MNRNIKRKLSYGSNATLVTVMLIVVVVVVYGVFDKNRFRWDLSETNENQLAEDTVHKIKLLEEDNLEVVITAFSAQSGKADTYFKNRELKDLLEEIGYHSPIIKTRFIDFDRERLTAEALGVKDYSSIVIQRGENRVDIKNRDLFRNRGKGTERVQEFMGEAAINQAFSQLMTDKRRNLYVLQGHGELSITSTEPDGLSELDSLLKQEHYFLKELDLIRESGDAPPDVPDDAVALIVPRSTTRLTSLENEAIGDYIAEGGSVLFLLDVGFEPPMVLNRFGVSQVTGFIMDKVRIFPFDDRPVPVYGNHLITKDLSQERLVTVLAHIAPLKVQDPMPEGVYSTVLLKTTRDGWIDRGGELVRGSSVFESTIDEAGPVDMALALEVLPRKSRLVVVGDANFATNALLQEGPGNTTFLVNIFRWLVKDDVRLSVVGRPTKVRSLALTEEDTSIIRWTVLLLMPLLIVVLGAAVWTSRRGR